jgi:hypothetical protein
MILKDLKKKSIDKRNFCSLSLWLNGRRRMLFRFESSSYKGTTFLTIEKSNDEKLQYLYLNSIGSPRQIASSDKEKNFIDTDIAYEDMGGANINDYTYKRLPDIKIGNVDCYVIERYPKRKNSKYKKYYMVIDKTKLLPIQVKAYNKGGRLIKIIKAFDIRKIGDNIYYPFKTVVTDIPEKHQTIIKIKSAIEKRIRRGYFNKNRMHRKWSEE